MPLLFVQRVPLGCRPYNRKGRGGHVSALGISAETVKLHVSAIFRAYGVHSRTQLVLLCSRSPSALPADDDDVSSNTLNETAA